ncbi:MAG: hypothetical protein A0129_01185, partial [Limnobacter sp. CACIAM 66H1]
MIQRSCRIPVPLADCFALYTRLKPDEYIHSDALIAPITRIEMIQGKSFNEVGDIQRITFKGGAVIDEEVLAFIPNRQFVYKGTGFSQPLLNWLDHAKGSFEFEKDGDGTVVTWRYHFLFKTRLGHWAQATRIQGGGGGFDLEPDDDQNPGQPDTIILTCPLCAF